MERRKPVWTNFKKPIVNLDAEIQITPSTQATSRIVLIDDDELFRESLEQNLHDSGYTVRAFDRGEPALTFFEGGGGADVVLLDWKMPEMNGIEVLRRLRQINQDVPVIFLTVLSDQIYEEAALSSGAVDFVEKSRSFTILLRRMGLILSGIKAGPGAGAPTSPAADGVSELIVGSLQLNLESNRAFWRNGQVELTLTEFGKSVV